MKTPALSTLGLSLLHAPPSRESASQARLRLAEEVIALIPRDFFKNLKQPSQIEGARRTAKAILQRDAVGNPVTKEVELGEWAPWAGHDTDTDKIRIGVRDMLVDVVGLDFNSSLGDAASDRAGISQQGAEGMKVKAFDDLRTFPPINRKFRSIWWILLRNRRMDLLN